MSIILKYLNGLMLIAFCSLIIGTNTINRLYTSKNKNMKREKRKTRKITWKVRGQIFNVVEKKPSANCGRDKILKLLLRF